MSAAEETFALYLRHLGVDFAREYRFHVTRRWRFDFAIFPLRAVEIEGGVFSSGRHTRGNGFSQDCEKYNEATALGWRVYRFPTAAVRDGSAFDFLERAEPKIFFKQK